MIALGSPEECYVCPEPATKVYVVSRKTYGRNHGRESAYTIAYCEQHAQETRYIGERRELVTR